MAEQKLNGLRVAILATDGFEQVELIEPRKALQQAGAKTTVIAPKSGKIQGMKHAEKADKVEADMTLDKRRARILTQCYCPVAPRMPTHFGWKKERSHLQKKWTRQSKPIAVICHGSWLVSAGLVKGHTLTSYHTIQDDIRNAGGQWVDDEVVHDQSWVSSRQPSDIPAFDLPFCRPWHESKKRRREVFPTGAARSRSQ